jgi:hypothetical protein
MSSPSALSRALDRAFGWFATPRDSLPMCAARAGLGFVLLVSHLQYLPYVGLFFGPHGIGGHDSIARHPGYPGVAFQWFPPFRLVHLLSSEAAVWALYGLLLVAAACFAVGFKGRVAGAVAGVLHIVFNAHNPKIDAGWAWLIGPFVLYLTLCDASSQLSIDGWRARRRGRAPARVAAPWGMRLLQVHLCAMYLIAGFERLDAAGWRHGDMVLHALINTQYGRFDVDWLALAPALRALTFAILLLEPAAPFLLWLPFVGRYTAIALIAMHLGLEVLIDAGWWQPMMISALVTFLPPRWLRRLPLVGDRAPRTVA